MALKIVYKILSLIHILILILKNGTAHVIILSDIRFVCTGLPFFVILKLDIAFDPGFGKAPESIWGRAGSSHCGQRLLQRKESFLSEGERDQKLYQASGSRKTEDPCIQSGYRKVL